MCSSFYESYGARLSGNSGSEKKSKTHSTILTTAKYLTKGEYHFGNGTKSGTGSKSVEFISSPVALRITRESCVILIENFPSYRSVL